MEQIIPLDYLLYEPNQRLMSRGNSVAHKILTVVYVVPELHKYLLQTEGEMIILRDKSFIEANYFAEPN
jgi:hypothetical protein